MLKYMQGRQDQSQFIMLTDVDRSQYIAVESHIVFQSQLKSE